MTTMISISRSLGAFSAIMTGVFAPLAVEAQQDGVFRDDFVGETMNPAWVVDNEDPDRWTLIGDEHLLIVPTESNERIVNTIRYTMEVANDFSFEMKIDELPRYENQSIWVWLQGGEGDWVGLGYSPARYWLCNDYDPCVSFVKHLKGKNSHIRRNTGRIGPDKSLYLRIEKRGVEYKAFYSTTGDSWVNVGKHALLRFKGVPSFAAHNSKTDNETPVKIDYVQISPL